MTSKNSFWRDLQICIGQENLLIYTRDKCDDYSLIKRQFKVLKDWIKNNPYMTHEVVSVSSDINHPIPYQSKLKVISLSSEIRIHTPLEGEPDEYLELPEFETESRKFYSCVAHWKNYIAINKDDSNIHIYKNKEYLSKVTFEGLILQIEIRNDYLYIRGVNQNGHHLTIFNLNFLGSPPKEVFVPLELTPSSMTNAYFGQTHIILTNTEGSNTTLIATSYEDLLNFSEDPIWGKRIETGHLILFEDSDRFICIKVKSNQNFSIAEMTCSKGELSYQVLEEEISIFQSPYSIYHRFDYIQGRIFIAYNDNGFSRVGTYDIETKKLSRMDLPDGPGFYTILPLPCFIASTPLKIYYLTFPFENGYYNIQKISIFGFKYDSPAHF